MRGMPAGYVPIQEAISTVGRNTFGADWLGDQMYQLMRMTSQARYRGPRNGGEKALISQYKDAEGQRSLILHYILREFRVHDADFDIRIIADDRSIHAVPAEAWDNDAKGLYALESGLLTFRTASGLEISGHLIIAGAALHPRPSPTEEAQSPESREAEAPVTPTIGSPPGVRTSRQRGAERAAEIWLAALKERPPSREWAFEQAKIAVRDIGELSEKAFKRAWANIVPDEWTKGGRRKKPGQ